MTVDVDVLEAEVLWTEWQPRPGCLAAPLGLADDGSVAEVELTDPDTAHVLFSGGTGTGKTVALNVLTAGLALHQPPDGLRVLATDCWGWDLYWLARLPHLELPVAGDEAAGLAILRHISGLIRRRFELLEAAGIDSIHEFNARSDSPLPIFLLLINELLEVASDAATLRAVLTGGGRVGIHVLAATQASAYLPHDLVQAFPAQVVGHCVADDSMHTLGTTAATAITGAGTAIMVAGHRSPALVQRAYIGTESLDTARFWRP